jgi:hypothetical protein
MRMTSARPIARRISRTLSGSSRSPIFCDDSPKRAAPFTDGPLWAPSTTSTTWCSRAGRSPTDFERELPDLYWLNYLGPGCVSYFGDRLGTLGVRREPTKTGGGKAIARRLGERACRFLNFGR